MFEHKVSIIEKHPRIIRWLHWINFPILSLMIWSGILIYWANPAYLKLPDSFYETLGLDHNLARGMGWHFFLMWIFTVNGCLYVAALLITGQWRELWPDWQSFKEAPRVVLHEIKILKTPPPIRGKYNAAQRLAYFFVILMGLGSLITGLAIYKPVQLGFLTQLLGGYQAARLEHFILMIGFVLFFLVHVFQVMKAGWNNFRSMLAGYEVVKK